MGEGRAVVPVHRTSDGACARYYCCFPERAVWEAISDGRDVVDLGGREVPARSYAVIQWVP